VLLVLAGMAPVTGAAVPARQTGVDGNQFTSATWGFEVEWDDGDWEVEFADDSPDLDGYDYLDLESGRSFVWFEGTEAYDGDPTTCLAEEAATLGSGDEDAELVPDLEPASAGLEGAGEAEVFAVPSEPELVFFLECRTLVETEAVLIIRQTVRRNLYQAELPLVRELLESVDAPVVAAKDADPGLSDGAYASPTYGYELAWEQRDWATAEARSRGGRDHLELYRGEERTEEASTVTFVAREGFDGDAEACLDAAVASVEDEADEGQPELLERDGAPLAGDEDGRAWAAYVFTEVSEARGTKQEFAVYLECRTLVEGEAILEILQIVAADRFEDEWPVVEDLLETLTLPETA
jgi:hypothetical protein